MEVAGLADDQFRRIMTRREANRKLIEQLSQTAPSSEIQVLKNSGTLSPDELKKKYLFDQSGMLDRLVSVTEKVSKITDSTAGKAMICTAKRLLGLMWNSL